MRLGINCIAPSTIPVISQLYQTAKIDFCEIMVDNFIHCHPEDILSAFTNIPLSLHLVVSRFIERPIPELYELANYLRPWIKQLAPIYVSDHIIQFNNQQNQRLALPQEFAYDLQYPFLKERVELWQSLLNCQIHFENHASLTKAGESQAQFYARLLTETNAGLLYDISNAEIADHNRICDKAVWQPLRLLSQHFHVAGFSYFKNQLAIDTHDQPLTNTVLSDVQGLFSQQIANVDPTLVIEFDAGVNINDMMTAIDVVRALPC